jgi:flagellin
MGLRINTNISALTALRLLQRNEAAQAKSLERLATGLAINRASDNPSGLVISEQLRAQIAALSQAVENSQNSSNLISTADAALQEVSDLLVDIQSSIVFAQNTGGSTPEQIAAEQSAVDQSLAAIDRIAATTRFGDRNLLNGTVDFVLSDDRPAELNDLKIRSVAFNPGETDRDLEITVNQVPLRARARFDAIVSTAAGTVLRVTGPRGTEDVALGAATTSGAATGLAEALNQVAGYTGVFASASTNVVNIFSEEYGAGQTVRLEMIEGQIDSPVSTESDTGNLGTLGVVDAGPMIEGEVIFDEGRDGIVSFQGAAYNGVGRSFSILSRTAQFTFSLNPDLIQYTGRPVMTPTPTISTATTFSFEVANTGLNFQLNELPRPTDRISLGIEGIGAAFLGIKETRDRISEAIAGIGTGALVADQIFKGGYLTTVKTGGDNDLTNGPQNAGFIVQEAIQQVAGLRGFLGAVQADTVEPNINAVEVHIENLSATLSTIRDLDFAAETTNFTRIQILFQSGIAVLASSNLIPQSILTLLG